MTSCTSRFIHHILITTHTRVFISNICQSKISIVAQVDPQSTNVTNIIEIKFEDLTLSDVINVGKGKEVHAATLRGDYVAVKMLELSSKNVPEHLVIAFKKETRIASSISHDRVVQVFGACVQPPNLAIVMELLRGNLETLLANQTIQWPLKIRIAAELVDGLNFLHNNKMFHRNICSSNILFDDERHVKISGFGIAKFSYDPKSYKTGDKPKGTSAWLAPELNVARDPPYSNKSDVYAYGVVLWELAAQALPYKGKDDEEIAELVDEGEHDPIPKDTPAEFAELIEACWAMDPKDRPETQEIKEKLDVLRQKYPM